MSTSEMKSLFPEGSGPDLEIIREAQNFSMTSPERLWALLQAVKYLEINEIRGDFLECGVWKGGSSLLMARSLERIGSHQRNIFLFDTFNGMVEPTDLDREYTGQPAKEILASEISDKKNSANWAFSTLREVKKTMRRSKYPKQKIVYVVGDVCQTLEPNLPDQVALARLDTDWYESTKCELQLIMPRMVKGGVVIVDDYGHWSGSKLAVDEWLESVRPKPLMNRIDYTGRMWVMP